METVRVLESAYGKSRNEILDAVQAMREMPVFEFEKDEVVERVLNDGRKSKADLADLLIAHSAQSCGCDGGITFDKGAAKFPFFSLLQ
jgi:predicted nucleic-acid-binding protein